MLLLGVLTAFLACILSVRSWRISLKNSPSTFVLERELTRTHVISQRYERGSIIITSNLPFDEWTEVFGAERLTGAILDRLTHHVHILEMNGDSFRLRQSRINKT